MSTRSLLRGVALAACAAAGATAGFASAALPPVPTLPTVTLPEPPPVLPAPTVPSVPVPTPTEPTPSVPSVPTLPVPTVPTVPPVPEVETVVVPPAAPTPPSTASVGTPAPLARGAGGGAGFGSSSAGSPSGAGAAPMNAPAGNRAAVRRTGRRGTVTIEFTLPRAGRFLLSAIGPLPSCAVERRVRLRARRGANAVPFAGALRGRRLPPGTYILVITLPASTVTTRAVVRVTRHGAAPVGAAARAAALDACPAVFEGGATALRRFELPVTSDLRSPGAAVELPSPVAAAPEPFDEVRGISGIEHVIENVSPVIVAVGALAILAAIAASLGGMVAFLRRRGQSA